jgi:hypothetical protein
MDSMPGMRGRHFETAHGVGQPTASDGCTDKTDEQAADEQAAAPGIRRAPR